MAPVPLVHIPGSFYRPALHLFSGFHSASGLAMFRIPLLGLLISALTAMIAVPLNAQEMRVYTVVRNLSSKNANEPDERAPVISRSLTLFHAGKVYDYVDAAREVTVFEPSHRRFTLLNERRRSVTGVAQDEVRQYLGLVEQEALARLEAANEQANASQLRSLSWLKFQLKPEFDVSFEPSNSTLRMFDHNCRYSVEGQAPPTRGVVETYLRFADATAELNSVLHPQAPLPRPRLQLNAELRRRELLPIVVELRANLDPPLHLQARHEWSWKFVSTDRQLISDWEAQMNDATQRRVGFRQFQQESLTTEVARNR
jgi:hypothetical protein